MIEHGGSGKNVKNHKHLLQVYDDELNKLLCLLNLAEIKTKK